MGPRSLPSADDGTEKRSEERDRDEKRNRQREREEKEREEKKMSGEDRSRTRRERQEERGRRNVVEEIPLLNEGCEERRTREEEPQKLSTFDSSYMMTMKRNTAPRKTERRFTKTAVCMYEIFFELLH